MPFVKSHDGTGLFYQETGQGPSLVFLHGINLSHEAWDGEVTAFHKEFRVITLDLRGHGQSDKPSAGYSYETLAADVGVVLSELEATDAVLVGWSLGGAVALRYATGAGRSLNGLVLVAAAVPRMVQAPDWPMALTRADADAALRRELSVDRPAFRRAVLQSMFDRPPSEETLDWLWSLSMRATSWASAACRNALYDEDLRRSLEEVRVRTLVVHGRRDMLVPFASAEMANRVIADSRLVALESSGHAPHLEQPEEFRQAIGSFAREAHAAGPRAPDEIVL